MIVDQLESHAAEDGRVRRSARLRWIGGEFRLWAEVPDGFQPPEEDATALLLVALPLALYRGEDLQLDGAVSAQTLRQTERIQTILAAWDPAVRRCRVRVAHELALRQAADGNGCLLSRGVDSMYSAIASHTPPLTHLVFCDTLTPLQSQRVRIEERRIVEKLASLIGLPVLRISTNLRDPGAQLIDYQDMHGAGIAFMAHSLSGGLGRVVVPSGLTYAVAGPAGSHPLLDPLFGSEWLVLDHHGLELGRTGKLEAILEHCPELLAHLKVCYTEASVGNCGGCRKCLWTMIALQAAGALEHASLFPAEIDLDGLALLRVAGLPLTEFWMQAAESLGDAPEDRRVREAVRRMLHRSVRPSLPDRARGALAWIAGTSEHAAPYWSTSPSGHFRHQTNAAIAALRAGKPYPYGVESATPQPSPAWSVGPLEPDWGPPLSPSSAHVGLLRMLDARGRRHRYAAGVIAPIDGLVRIGELGALLRDPGDGRVPVWISAEGRVSTDSYDPSPAPLAARTVFRWTLAPLSWRRLASRTSLLRELLRRATDARDAVCRAGLLTASDAPSAAPVLVGYLRRSPQEGAVALYSAIHPVNADQLLSTDASESSDLGYNAPVLLGFLEADAPASGTLGVSRPRVPWASRLGAGRARA